MPHSPRRPSRVFKMARKEEEVFVYLDPTVEKGDGDTIKDSGKIKKNRMIIIIEDHAILSIDRF